MGLRAQLAGVLPDDLLPYLSDHFEVVGTIAILSLSPRLHAYREVIARAIVANRRSITAVLAKTGPVAGPGRAARYELILGETTETVHNEFGYAYRIDPARSFFSTRLAYERRRVTEQVKPGERVFVPFAGVGPFVVPAAARGGEVRAVEQNPDAFRFLLDNIRRNQVVDSCHAVHGDALDPALFPGMHFDRIIIPAPYGMDHAAGRLLPLLAAGGIAHVYTFLPKEDVPRRQGMFVSLGFEVLYTSNCGNVAPGISRWVFDLASPARP